MNNHYSLEVCYMSDGLLKWAPDMDVNRPWCNNQPVAWPGYLNKLKTTVKNFYTQV